MDALAATMVVDRNAAAYSARRKSDAAIAKKNWRLVQNSVRVLGEVKHASHHAAKLVPKDDIAYGLKNIQDLSNKNRLSKSCFSHTSPSEIARRREERRKEKERRAIAKEFKQGRKSETRKPGSRESRKPGSRDGKPKANYEDEKEHIIKQVTVFNKFTDEQFDYVVSRLRKMQVDPMDTVIFQGTAGDEFFMLVQGTAVVTRKNDPFDPTEVR